MRKGGHEERRNEIKKMQRLLFTQKSSIRRTGGWSEASGGVRRR